MVKRPNHGLASSLRKAALVPSVAAAYHARYGKHASKGKGGMVGAKGQGDIGRRHKTGGA